jgi:predicted Zn-dependent protease
MLGNSSVFAQNRPEEDDFLQLLREELQLQYDSLQRTEHPPYFIAYRVKESTEHRISADYGKIYDNSTSKTVFLTIEMRVGTPETDNYHYLTYRNTYVSQIPLPLEENPVLVRKILQKETRKAYQEAVIQFVENKLATTYFDAEEDIEKFLYMRNDKDGYYEAPVSIESHWNELVWESNLRHCTSNIQSSAELRCCFSRNYLVNSENSFFVQNESSALLTLRMNFLTTQDHIPEYIERQYFGQFPDQLPDASTLELEMTEMETSLSNVLLAEKCDISHCPVLLSPKAASVLMHSLLGHDLENSGDSWLRVNFLLQVMPESFSVYSDPTVSKVGGLYCGGTYMFDDEGVKGHKVQHIDHGVFQQFLSTRMQRSNAFKSNGNARCNALLPSARQSNLFVESDKMLDKSKLFELLVQEAGKQSLEKALYVEEVEVRCDTNDILSLYPTVCYEIYANHRKPDEIVRDVVLIGTKQQWLSNLLAAGGENSCVTMTCHSQRDDLLTSCSTPSLLFRDVEVRQRVKEPQSPRIKMDGIIATASSTPISTGELFRLSAQSEWDADVNHLKIGDETAPYYEEFLMTDARFFAVEASEGSVFYANEKPVRQLVPRVLLGSDRFNNENLTEITTPPASYSLPFENRSTFDMDFRKAAEAEYNKSLKQWKIKQALVPIGSRNNPDRSISLPTQANDERVFEYPTLNNLEHFAREASAQLAKHDFLNRSGVNVYVMLGNVYFWNSETTTYSRPVSVIGVQIWGSVERNSKDYIGTKTIFLPSTDSLFSPQVVQNEIDRLVSHLRNVKQLGEENNGCFSGPVLIEGDAVGQLLVSALLESNYNLLAYSEPLIAPNPASPFKKQSFEDQLDKIIISKDVSVTANKSGDKFDKYTFVRHEKTDAEGVEAQETEIIRKGELVALMGNRTITKSMSYSNGFQQLSIHNEACFTTRGANRLDFEYKKKVSHAKLRQMLIKEAKKQGCQYAYILRQVSEPFILNVQDPISQYTVDLLQLYRVDVRTGQEVPILGCTHLPYTILHLQDILYVSDTQAAFPVMMKVPGAKGTRDFPFAGVPTCIVAPDGILLDRMIIEQ